MRTHAHKKITQRVLPILNTHTRRKTPVDNSVHKGTSATVSGRQHSWLTLKIPRSGRRSNKRLYHDRSRLTAWPCMDNYNTQDTIKNECSSERQGAWILSRLKEGLHVTNATHIQKYIQMHLINKHVTTHMNTHMNIHTNVHINIYINF